MLGKVQIAMGTGVEHAQKSPEFRRFLAVPDLRRLFLYNLNNTAFKSNLLASVITERPARVRLLGRSQMVPPLSEYGFALGYLKSRWAGVAHPAIVSCGNHFPRSVGASWPDAKAIVIRPDSCTGPLMGVGQPATLSATAARLGEYFPCPSV